MVWILIIILILIVMFIIGNQKHNKNVENYHLDRGGFRKSFPNFTTHLENFYGMTFLNDTGKNFSYFKEIFDSNGNIGTLIVGVKLDMRDEPIIFSKFKNVYKGEYSGIDVSGVNFNDSQSIDKCINISIEKIKSYGVINYSDMKSGFKNHSVSKEFIDSWAKINSELSDHEISSKVDTFVNNFFISDLISPLKFMENLDILVNTWKSEEENYGTESIKDFFYIPPAFDKFFIAAYPDVYNWYQKNADSGNVEIQKKLEELSDDEVEKYFNEPSSKIEFYRSLINQYKREGNKLETSG